MRIKGQKARVLVKMADLKDQCGMLSAAENQNMNTAMNIRTGILSKHETCCKKDVAFFELTPFLNSNLKGEKAHSSLQYLCAKQCKRCTWQNNLHSNA
jgi:glycine cleavage system aminomethyltransferase T